MKVFLLLDTFRSFFLMPFWHVSGQHSLWRRFAPALVGKTTHVSVSHRQRWWVWIPCTKKEVRTKIIVRGTKNSRPDSRNILWIEACLRWKISSNSCSPNEIIVNILCPTPGYCDSSRDVLRMFSNWHGCLHRLSSLAASPRPPRRAKEFKVRPVVLYRTILNDVLKNIGNSTYYRLQKEDLPVDNSKLRTVFRHLSCGGSPHRYLSPLKGAVTLAKV